MVDMHPLVEGFDASERETKQKLGVSEKEKMTNRKKNKLLLGSSTHNHSKDKVLRSPF
jgi:hypothetical protein